MTPKDKLLQEAPPGDWPEYRLLILSKLNDIQLDQQAMGLKIEAIALNQQAMKLDMMKEVTANATRRGFIGSAIPTLISIAIMVWNILHGVGNGNP